MAEQTGKMITADAILHDLETYIYNDVCVSHGEKKALACARALFDCLWLNFRYSLMYIPTSAAVDLRNETIWAEFNGRNHIELTLKYHLSLVQVYKIIKFQKTKSVRKIQDDIFPTAEPATSRALTPNIIAEYLPAELTKCGLSNAESEALAKKISNHLLLTYPGISIRISEYLHRQRTQTTNQTQLF